ncbi:phytochelatin synthase family protein [Myxococcota bacterium]|nr:phytochelatin synthase family protein [Myxococcota bacterium]
MRAPGFHRRPLPAGLVDFRAPEGRALLAQALAAGTAEAFFPLVAHLHTQAEPAWCGLGTLVTVLNALEVDPGRTWKGPWRWFGEELLDCCKSLDVAAAEGLTLEEVACLARCNGAAVEVVHAGPSGEAAFRRALEASVRAPAGPFLVAAYDRAGLGQTGSGHYSPLAAWHPERDLVLILDVARFKYPSHWAPVERLWAAMQGVDPASGRSRGWLSLARADRPEVAVTDAQALSSRLSTLGAAPAPCCPAREP